MAESVCGLVTWAARYNTWLLIELTPKGVVFSFLSFSFCGLVACGCGCHTWPAVQALVEMHRVGAAMHKARLVCCSLRPAAARHDAKAKLQELIQQQSMWIVL